MVIFNALPLEKHSSLHKIPILRLVGINANFSPKLIIAFNFNLQTSLQKNTKAHLIFHLCDDHISPTGIPVDLSINQLRRWRLDIRNLKTYDDFLHHMNPRLYKKYLQTEEIFNASGVELRMMPNDWSQYADIVYQLYLKVATKNGAQLYDLDFFRNIAKRNDYKLMCAWYQDEMIGALVMVDEQPIFHSAICVVDYEHSKNARIYSQMHYQFIRMAIEENKYTIADVGITADKAKSMMNFHPIPSRMHIYASSRFLKLLLHILSSVTYVTINSEAQLKFKFRWFGFLRRK